jgi:hypothetical protein
VGTHDQKPLRTATIEYAYDGKRTLETLWIKETDWGQSAKEFMGKQQIYWAGAGSWAKPG